jgi:1,2-diacylglycerol 3-beta-galactosyltransferase
LVLTADAGLGHRSAAKAIAAALKETHGDDCDVRIVNPLDDKRVPSALRRTQTGHDKYMRDLPELYTLGYKASDRSVPSTVIESALKKLLFEAMRDLVRRYEPDAIVTTYPLYQSALKRVYTVNRCSVPLLTVVTDLTSVHRLWFHKVASLCLVPTEQIRDQALASGLSPSRVHITGIPVHPNVARESREPAEIRAELGWQTDLPAVLAVGGTRVMNFYDVMMALDHAGLPLQLAVVAGGDANLYRRLMGTEWHAVTHVYDFVTNMPALMHAADCIICKAGGLIVTEALACGLPLLLTDIRPGPEEGNAAYVVEGGAGELTEEPHIALQTLYHWLDNDGAQLSRHAENSQALGRPYAAYEIAERAWVAAVRGPVTATRRFGRVRPKLSALLHRYRASWRGKASSRF